MSKPVCVIAGDIHYDLKTLEVADKATRVAIAKANELNVPFVANGDTITTKALLRAEYVNAMIETFKTAKIKPYVNIGNHCKINARGTEHALNFLAPYAHIVDRPTWFTQLDACIIPYFDDIDELRKILKQFDRTITLIMHQGLNSSNMGHYMTDHSALNPEDLSEFRTILSHYHARQDIKCGRPRAGGVGLATYIGSPYTTSFGEANDLEKGFSILMSDGTLEFVPTNLRRHVIITLTAGTDGILRTTPGETPQNDNDIVWVKITGPTDIISRYDKAAVAFILKITQSFKLELIPQDLEVEATTTALLSKEEILDHIISGINEDNDRKARLKKLWRDLV